MLRFAIALLLLIPTWTLADVPFAYPSAVEGGWGGIERNLMEAQEAEVAEIERSLAKSSPEKVSTAIAERNANLLRELNQLKGPGLTRAQAQNIQDRLRTHPLASETGTRAYDRPNRSVGFCFGRATFVHLELFRLGVHPRSIAKLFAVGSIKYAGSIWDYHVSTIVKKEGGGWWAIDGLAIEVQDVESWMKGLRAMSFNKRYPKLRFFVTDATKLLPLPGGYEGSKLGDPLYRGFFTDLADWFRKHPVAASERFVKD